MSLPLQSVLETSTRCTQAQDGLFFVYVILLAFVHVYIGAAFIRAAAPPSSSIHFYDISLLFQRISCH